VSRWRRGKTRAYLGSRFALKNYFYEINATAADDDDDDNCSIYILLELSVHISSSKTVNITRP